MFCNLLHPDSLFLEHQLCLFFFYQLLGTLPSTNLSFCGFIDEKFSNLIALN